jgi:membrane fusion protein (multidrug efflux system)
MSWRKITFVVVALIILLGGSAALSKLFVSMKPEPPRMPEVELKRYVKTETVTYTEVVSPLISKGRVVSSSEVTLVSEAGGKIESGDVALRKGTSFKKGQLLATIYKDELELAIKARKSSFLTTITTLLPDVKVDYPNQLEAFSQFFSSISMNEKLPELPEIKDEQFKIFLASRNVFNEYYSIMQDEKRLSRHSLYAPFDGAFTEVSIEVGAYTNIGGKIGEMIRTDLLEVEVPVENYQSKWIRIGDRVKVYSSIKESVKPGVVVRKSDFIDENTQSRSIFIKVQNSQDDDLLSGEYKLVEFPGQKIQNAMELPRGAVFNSNEVFIVDDGKLKKRIIEVVKWNETSLIFKGLEEGAKVVSEPLINVKENSPVGIIGEEKPDVQRNGNKKGNSNSQRKG